jgi:uncharacterized protein
VEKMSNENLNDKSPSIIDEKKLDQVLYDALDIVESKDVDGFRLLEYKEDGVYLIIYAPHGNGKPIEFEKVIKEISERRIQGHNVATVMQAVREMSGKPVKIAGTQAEIREDGHVAISMSKDRMEAYITVYPPKGGAPVKFDKVLELLQAEGIVYGIDHDKVKEAIELQQVSETITIAKGIPAINGQDAIIGFEFEPAGIKIHPKELANGKTDFYNLNLVQNVNVGTILATKKPATSGEVGKTITGQDLLPKQGKDLRIQPGKNVELLEDGLTLVAGAEGHVVYQAGKISVSTVYEVKGDVDFSTGNIDFIGSVVIRGSIRPGFIVKATGDIEIGESISGGSVVSGGHVKVKSGIQGNQKGHVYASGNIFAKFVENANLYSGESIMIGEAIMHSHVEAQRMVVVGGKKGLIVGGIVRAGEEIEAKIIGSSLATGTEVEAGVNPEKKKQYIELCEALNDNEQSLDKATKALKMLKQLEAQLGDLDPDKKAMLIKLTRTQFQLMNENQELKEKKEIIEDELEQLQHGKIKVSGLIHPGVKVTVGNASTIIRDDLKFACLVKDQGQIRIDSYK